jgi:hypothetical protein
MSFFLDFIFTDESSAEPYKWGSFSSFFPWFREVEDSMKKMALSISNEFL